MSAEAKRSILNFTGEAGWPKADWDLFHSGAVLRRRSRFKLVLLLKGNGCKDEWIRAVVSPRLRDEDCRKVLRRKEHVESILRDAQACKYDEQWAYRCLRDNDIKYLSGRVCTDRPAPSPAARLINGWDEEISRVKRTQDRYPTMAEQEAYFASPADYFCEKFTKKS